MQFKPKWFPSGRTQSLRTKFIIGIVLLECLLMTGTFLVVERQMRKSILDEFLKLGTAISNNLAAVNENYVTTYNYVGIEQSVSNAASNNGLAYALIQYFDGDVAAYSGTQRIWKDVVRKKIDHYTFKTGENIVNYYYFENSDIDICEIASPIIIGDTQWATVRVGLPMNTIQSNIGSTRKALLTLGLIVLALGCLLSVLFSRRITRPVASLVKDVEAISKGDYEQEITINTRDEIGYLARRFGSMKESLKVNIRLLQDSNHELLSTNRRLKGLYTASQAINSIKNQDRLYDLILETALAATDALGASITLMDSETDPNVRAVIVREGIDKRQTSEMEILLKVQPQLTQFKSLDSSMGACRVNLEYLENTPIIRTWFAQNPEYEILSIPLGAFQDISGSINLIKRKRKQLDTNELQALSVLVSQTTTSIENHQLFNQLEQAYLSSIKSLAKTLELKDQYTHGHAERVAEVCNKIAVKMNMDKADRKILYNAALLHDIGKIGVLESILNKNSSLDTDEYLMIKKHPQFGDEILRPIFNLKKERNIVRHHHEKEDGSGYPDGLDGSQLSLSEKIIIVADAYDAMNSRRSYRDALGGNAICEEFKRNKGNQFDPQVVDVFFEVYHDKFKKRQEKAHVISFPVCSAY